MIQYQFTAKEHGTNRIVKGNVSADNEQAAAKLLADKQLFVVNLKPFKKGGLGDLSFDRFQRISGKDKVLFTRQLATLVKAGLPITQAFRTAVEQVDNKKLRVIMDSIKASVEGGSSLSAAFGQYPDVFNRTFVSLVNAGEESGTLDKTLERLADQMEKEQQIKSKIRGALIYPAIVLAVIVMVVVFMLVTVLPQIKSLYSDLGKTLPFLTRALLLVSDFLKNFWYIAIVLIIAGIFGMRAWIRTPHGRKKFDQFKLNVPLVKVLFQKMYMARFSRTLGVLVVSGVPILEALNITSDAVTNEVLKEEVMGAAGAVKGGTPLSKAIEKYPYFTNLVPQMIKIGEDSGALGDMLDKVATFYEDEVDQAVKNLSTFIEPILMVVMGIMVGFIIVAVLFPVYNLVGSGVDNLGSTNNTTNNATK